MGIHIMWFSININRSYYYKIIYTKYKVLDINQVLNFLFITSYGK